VDYRAIDASLGPAAVSERTHNPERFSRACHLFDFWTVWTGKAVRSLRNRGVAGSINFAAMLVKPVLSAPWWRYVNARFDRRFAVDTASIINLPNSRPTLGSSTPALYADASFPLLSYAATVEWTTTSSCSSTSDVVKARFFFLPQDFLQGHNWRRTLDQVDWGCRGEPKRYRGRLRCNTFDLACMDASEYQIPHEPAIYYFYNPSRRK